MEENITERNYKIKERSIDRINLHGSPEKAIEALQKDLHEMEDLWSLYSYDCVGQGITCTRLLISWISRQYNL